MKLARHATSAARRRAGAVPLEAAEQKTVVQWFWHAYAAYRGCLQASGNGLHIGGSTAAQKAAHWQKFMSMGGQPGQSDLFLSIPRGKYAGLYIEMKRRDGKRSDVTHDEFLFIGLMLRMGYQATWCAGAHEACAVIEDYMAQVGGE